jgi:hypothetical protein
MTLRFETRLFTLAKDPDLPGAYQDAACIDSERHMAAIADGVSSALFSGPWAAILAEAVVADNPNPGDAGEFADWLRHQRARWAATIDTGSLAWFQKAKLPQGAFSTLLYARVCEVEESRAGLFGGYRLLAFALGDSCLFQVRGDELVRSFPLAASAQFEDNPMVLGSVDLKRDHLLEFAFLDEMCYPGDELILCTDAVAEWAVRCYESGEPPVWSDFWHMAEEDWQSGVAWLRQERQMRIDDATMLLVRVGGERVEPDPAAGQPQHKSTAADEDQAAEDASGLGWIDAAAKDLKSISGQVAEQVDHTSEQVIKGLRSLRDRAMKKYRDTFGKKPDAE